MINPSRGFGHEELLPTAGNQGYREIPALFGTAVVDLEVLPSDWQISGRADQTAIAGVNKMPDTAGNLASLLFLGFLLGVRHATDADHIIAIATIVTRQRNFRGSAMIGAVWGIGHTLTILVVGSAIILFGVVIPPRLGLAMELGVGIMLILLGVLTLTGMGGVINQAASLIQPSRRRSPDLRGHAHAHGDYVHSHMQMGGGVQHGHREDQTPLARLDAWFGGLAVYQWLRPMAIGIVHGLAGSAAVVLLWSSLSSETRCGRSPTFCCSAPGPSAA